ncbi:MAG TPA: response regulator [Nitrososphaeraceae archaeon]|nr:response regulator [Nitrososphaeraceae archaeon]
MLLVDDEKDILTLYHECVEAWGYPAISFNNPIEALNYIDNENNICNHSLIITDYRMPQMNGLELIQHIREKYIIKNDDCQLKVILISAFVISELL